MTLRFYLAIMEKGPDGTIGVSFPDFPGCTSAGDDMQEAASNALEALSLHVEGMIEDGEALPAPSAPDAPLPDWMGTPDGQIVRAIVPLELPGRRVKVNLNMDEALVNRMDAAANADGLTRSSFVAAVVRDALRTRAAG